METIIIKLGGALITDKSKPFSLRYDVLKRVAKEVAEAYKKCRSRLIVVHGGGSFGHYVVNEHGSINTCDAIAQTIWFMREFNMIIVDALLSLGIPAVAFDTHALALIREEKLYMSLEPLRYSLNLGLIPVLYGDIVLEGDKVRIVSGDEIAWYLSKMLAPSRLLFASTVDGVYRGDPSDPKAELLDIIKVDDIYNIYFGKAQGFDVTGGMKLKLILALKYLTKEIKEVLIFNGLKEGFVYKAICGLPVYGTRVVL